MLITRKLFQEKKWKKSRKRNSKNYSPTKVKVQNFLTNLSYNRLKNVDFNNASCIIDWYTYILFKLNPFFLEQNIDDKNDWEERSTLWNNLISYKFYIYICRNDNFIELNKLGSKYQNPHYIWTVLLQKTLTTFLNSKNFF